MQTSLLICPNQWTGFYMIEISVMKELSEKNLRKITKKIFETLSKISEGTFVGEYSSRLNSLKEIRIEINI